METADLTVVYGIVALLSVMLCLTYFLFDKRKNQLFLALFSCVAASNLGYFLLSICSSLTVARVANAISYFGGAFSLLVMLFIIYDVCQLNKKKWFTYCFIGISIAVFVIAASGDWLGLYYKSIALETINGMTHLVKVYGPLHRLYALYLIG